MSYYGYPNAQAYSANYAQYAAAYAAHSGTYDQYQAAAAYNAAAYTAMQQQQQQQQQQTSSSTSSQSVQAPKQPSGPPPGISISGTPQRYDYQTVGGSNYDANTYPPPPPPSGQHNNGSNNTSSHHQQHQNQNQGFRGRGGGHGGPKWGQLPGQPGAAKFNKPGYGAQGFGGGGGGGRGGGHQGNVRRNQSQGGGGQVQVFYCEVCKISCAGPQTYKEHLEGQKHKKKEAANKLNETALATTCALSQALSPSAVQANPSNTASLNQPTQQHLHVNQNLNNPNNANRRHLANTANINRTTTSTNLVIQCALCDIACTGKDAYTAHVRGAKHQKTIKLHQKLGKPIPPDNPVYTNVVNGPNLLVSGGVMNVQQQGGVISAPAQLVGQPTEAESSVNSNLAVVNTLESETGGQRMEGMAMEEELMNIEPVGKEYIETKQDGKILSFYCKLCECQFNDPNAKDMHTKGRRHRLAYKRKVDPSLRVDMKGHHENKLMKQQQRNRSREMSDEGQTRQQQQTGGLGAPMRLMEMTGISIKPGVGGVKPLMGGSEGQGIQKLMATQFNQYGPQSGPQNGGFVNRHETYDDKHIIAKHNLIYPSQEEISAIQEIVSCTEKALKLVSDQIADEDAKKSPQTPTSPTSTPNLTTTSPTSTQQTDDGTKKSDESNQVYRALKGVMRVGLLAKGLLLKGDTDVQLIVLCAKKPTKTLLARVHKILLEKIDIVSPETKYSIIHDQVAETIVLVNTTISDLQPLITCKIMLTSPLVRTDGEEAESATAGDGQTVGADKEKEPDTADLLDKQRCLDSLAPLRHAKWFQARPANLPNCVVIIRVLRDLCQRNPTWAPLSQWGLELLVEKCLSSSTSQLSLGEGLRRVLESVSSGILLPGGPGLYDPCEKEPTDVSNCLTNQQREELTSSAQMALRLLAFKQIYKILGMECLLQQNGMGRMAKKRPFQNAVKADEKVDEKKVKKEDEEVAGEDVKVKSGNVSTTTSTTTSSV